MDKRARMRSEHVRGDNDNSYKLGFEKTVNTIIQDIVFQIYTIYKLL